MLKPGAILVVNAGSSSLKFSVFRPGADGELQLCAHGLIDDVGASPALSVIDADGNTLAQRACRSGEADSVQDAIKVAVEWLQEFLQGEPVGAVGHRVVHGGVDFVAPVVVDEGVFAALQRLVPLAPLHQPHNLAAIRALQQAYPQVPQVACFDTAFHRGHPQVADLYALPWKFYQAGVRHYGFHGLSYEYIASRLPQVAPGLARGRVVVAHLGNGASLCALQAGRSMDSTMGFSPLDGIPMGTRPGALDPGVLLHLVAEYGLSADALAQLLYRESGLLGLSGISHDMRVLLASGEARARLAVTCFVHHIARHIGALTAVLGGLDGLVFTAGIGEHSAEIRARVMRSCAWLGIVPDDDANLRGGPRVSVPGGAVSAWVIPTDEELMIARHTRACVPGGA